MKQLKMCLTLLLTSFIFFVYSNVNAEEINVNGSNYAPLDNIISQYPNWSNSNWVQEKAIEFYNTYLSSYENVVITLRIYNSQTDGNYPQFNIIPYGDYFNDIGFSYVAWNNNYPIYFLKLSSYIDFVNGVASNSRWQQRNRDFVRGNYLYNDTSFTTMIEYGSSTYGSGFLTRAFYCGSLNNNICLLDDSGFKGGSSLPIVYYNFKTQDNFILPANENSSFNNNIFNLPNGTKIGNVNPISFNDLMQDNYYNFHKVDIQENKCDKTFVLGAVSNVNEINLNVKGKTSALSESLQGTFTLNYTNDSLLTDNNFNIEFSSTPELVGSYNFKCSSTDKFCYLNYKYNSQDDIEENVKFSFKITFNNNNSNIFPFTKIYSCTTDENYTNISYTYSNSPSDTTTSNPSLDNILTDTSNPDLGVLSNTSTWLPQGPVDSIIMLPLNFINTLVSKIGSTCSSVNLPIPFIENKYLTLPCMSTIFGQIENFSTLYDLIGVIGSVYLLYNYLLKFYKWIDDTLSFRENNWNDWGGE